MNLMILMVKKQKDIAFAESTLTELKRKNIAKGTTDPGVDYFNQ